MLYPFLFLQKIHEKNSLTFSLTCSFYNKIDNKHQYMQYSNGQQIEKPYQGSAILAPVKQSMIHKRTISHIQEQVYYRKSFAVSKRKVYQYKAGDSACI